jgi:hypothetical protein
VLLGKKRHGTIPKLQAVLENCHLIHEILPYLRIDPDRGVHVVSELFGAFLQLPSVGGGVPAVASSVRELIAV